MRRPRLSQAPCWLYINKTVLADGMFAAPCFEEADDEEGNKEGTFGLSSVHVAGYNCPM